MRIFWEFRSNLKNLEYYHEYKDYKTFKENCHDFYMLFPLWLLENDYFDEVIIWRLSNKPIDDIVFHVGTKRFIQRWVNSFHQTLKHPSPEISFWRGGFPEYDKTVNLKPSHFGKKLYLGAGKRVYPQFGGTYDAFLIEDGRDRIEGKKCIPFFKTASPQIFHPVEPPVKERYDICWPCNFTQVKYKGQPFFISQIAKNPVLQKLKIVHCGNRPEVGKELCRKFNVKNIQFVGSVTRPELNKYLNKSKFGMNLSNQTDGCPRVSTEILMSGTPLILMESVRLLGIYKKNGVIEVNENNLKNKIIDGLNNYENYRTQVLYSLKHEISFDKICQKNIERWKAELKI